MDSDRRRLDLERALKIDGWLTQHEAELLWDSAREACGPIVEIGCWRGRSTACIALGNQAGNRVPFFVVDSFRGIQPGATPTAHGQVPGWHSSTPDIVRRNIEAAGVDAGSVTIIPKPAFRASDDVPAKIGMLFVDGGHEYEDVVVDFRVYLPKVEVGGVVVVHDVTQVDPGVVRAFDEEIMSKPNEWQVLGRADSAVVARRWQAERMRVGLGCPGREFKWGAVEGIIQASLGAHQVQALSSGNGWDDFNAVWAQALNLAEAGEITHFAMLHSDVVPDPGWVDVLVGECERLGADMVSTAIPLKDSRGLTSCGLGDPTNRWGAWRRLTMRELHGMPATFGLADIPHPEGMILLHNTGCWVCDLRRDVFFTLREDGSLKCFFDFPTRVHRLPPKKGEARGKWTHARESEDWYFSRQLHEISAKTFITRRVRVAHRGEADYKNYEVWGRYKDDEDTDKLWREATNEILRGMGREPVPGVVSGTIKKE